MANLNFRSLRADEVMVRFKSLNAKDKGNATKATYLLYKDARCDMRILDEMFGSFGWSREHKMLDGKLYCSVSIYNEKTGSWVSKDDAGEETQVEATKGEASDAFKRVCFNWGIGRELYTAPKIEIPFVGDFESKNKAHYGLKVSEMVVEDHKITKLTIVDNFGKVRFEWSANAQQPAPQAKKAEMYDPTKEDAIYAAKTTLPRLNTKEDLLSLWFLYPQMHKDKEFIQLFTTRKNELGL